MSSFTENTFPFDEVSSFVTPGEYIYSVTLLTTTSPTPCLNPEGGNAEFLVGVVNNSLAAQSGAIIINDNASTASGVVIASIASLGPSQIITFPAPGLPLANGCVATCSVTPQAQGIQVLVR